MPIATITTPVTLDGSLGFLEDLSDQLSEVVTSHRPSSREHHLTWDSPSLAGHASQLLFDSGLELVSTSISGEHELDLELIQQPTGIQLEFLRSAPMDVVTEDGRSIRTQPGTFCLSHVRLATRFRCRSLAQCQRDQVGLQVHPDRLRDHLPSADMPVELERVLNGTDAFSSVEGTLSPAASRVLDSIHQNTLEGKAGERFLEARAGELLGLALESLYAPPMAAGVAATDAGRLELARARLLDMLDAPPSLTQLARLSGLNERKLKEGFKARFGTTVYGFVRRERMARAHRLLRKQRSVTDVAQRIGYANPSKFAAAFRREFGFAPSALAP